MVISYDKIQTMVDKAFQKLSGLSVQVTFHDESVQGYDWENEEAVITDSAEVTVPGFLYEQQDPVPGPTITLRLAVQPLPFEVTANTTMTIDGIPYGVAGPILNHRVLLEIPVARRN